MVEYFWYPCINSVTYFQKRRKKRERQTNIPNCTYREKKSKRNKIKQLPKKKIMKDDQNKVIKIKLKKKGREEAKIKKIFLLSHHPSKNINNNNM